MIQKNEFGARRTTQKTLRDEFAMSVIGQFLFKLSHSEAVSAAYHIADKMLVEREKRDYTMPVGRETPSE